MSIYKTLIKALHNSSTEEVSKKLSYNSLKKGEKSLAQFIQHKDLYSWLNSGFYDLKYTAEKLFKELCIMYGIEIEAIEDELKMQRTLKAEINKYQNCYIFINTNFIRKSEPIFVLAMLESKRYIKINAKQLIFKTENEILDIVSNIVKAHYKKTEGTLPIWGDIANYAYHHNDESVYIFNTLGKFIKGVSKSYLKQGRDYISTF